MQQIIVITDIIFIVQSRAVPSLLGALSRYKKCAPIAQMKIKILLQISLSMTFAKNVV